MRFIHYAIATGLGSGYAPKAPGTAGTILGLVVAWFFLEDPAHLLIATAAVTIIGTISSSYIEKDAGMEDPQIVVVDEIAGMWLSLWFLPQVWWAYLLAFGLFRLFDIWKPWPVDSLQNLHGGAGIMADDIGAGVYACLLTHLVCWVAIVLAG